MKGTKKLITTLLSVVLCIPASAILTVEPLDMERIREIAAMLPESPSGLGPTCVDRTFWDRLYESGGYRATIKKAEKMLEEGFPAWDQAKYDRVFSEGDTQSGKDVILGRMTALSTLVWAECLENRNRFTPLIRDFLYDIMGQKTWVFPRNYNPRNYGGLIELATASYSHNLAQVIHLLGDKLPLSVHEDVFRQLYTRAFNPLMATLEGKNTDHSWLKSTNNWNPVCLEGVVCAALAMIPDRLERAKYVCIAERYVQNYVEGFGEDGYCTEGISYYNYGMSHYLVLREKLMQDTGGRIDLFKNNPKIRNIAAFPLNIEILNGIYPSIADCNMNARPSAFVMRYLSRALDMDLPVERRPSPGNTDDLTVQFLDVFQNQEGTPDAHAAHSAGQQFRSFMKQSGILIVRTKEDCPIPMGAALKGGHNQEAHNHNDLGSYTIVLDHQKMVEDPGLIPYNIKTFGPERYTAFRSLGSYGHSTPLICGKDQAAGKECRAVQTGASFSDRKDCWTLDLSSAYAVPQLKKVERQFVFSRKRPSLTVRDQFFFDSKQVFETAVTTRSDVKIIDKRHVLLTRDGRQLMLTVRTDGGDPEIFTEEISEGRAPYTRIAIRLKPRKGGKVTLCYTPADTKPL